MIFFIKSVHIIEGELIHIVSGVFRNYVPHSTKEIGQDQNEDHKLNDLEALDKENLLHDLVVVYCFVCRCIFVFLYDFDECSTISLSNHFSESL